MDEAPNGGWRERRFGDEYAAERVAGEVHFLFGRGPRRPAADPDIRAAALLSALELEVQALRWCRQVHGKTLASLSAGPGSALTAVACVGRCDGLISADSGLGLLVWTADCVPVLMAGGGVVAAVHAGWRGTASGVVGAAVRRFRVEYGVKADELSVALGPAVGACHYEVGEEVVAALRETGVDSKSWLRGDSVDLRGLLSAELQDLGVRAASVELIGGCTACDRELCSYRRDGVGAGRQWSLIVKSRRSC